MTMESQLLPGIVALYNGSTMLKTILICGLALIASTVLAEPPTLQLNDRDAAAIGQKIWHNEGLGKVENLAVWNRGEAFPSLGIGHFIWYPAGISAPFEESFPQLIESLRQTRTLPPWLLNTRHAPWSSREEFYAEINSPRTRELRQLLHETIPQQTALIVKRMEASLPKMVASISSERERQHVQQQFYRVASQPNGLYALIDYVNFKGEGTSPKERYNHQGWGLLQLLESMPGKGDAMVEFAEAADFVLTRRVQNASRDESHWLPGWRNRLKSYLPE